MAGELYDVQVTSCELEVLRQYQRARQGKVDGEEVIARVVEALQRPMVYRLLQNWSNGIITLVIEFENGRVKYVTPEVKGPRLKAGRDL